MRAKKLFRLEILAIPIALVFHSADAFTIFDHAEITFETLSAYSYTTSDGKEIRWRPTKTEYRLDTIIFANIKTDLDQTDIRHCDNAKVADCKQRIDKIRDELVILLKANDPEVYREEAQKRLGTALHTIQDFYAHSSWVESQLTIAKPTLDVLQSNVKLGELPVCTNGFMLQGNPFKFTSGFYVDDKTGGLPQLLGHVNSGRCIHGQRASDPSDPNFFVSLAGIAKDNEGGYHDKAYVFAGVASEIFINEVRDGLPPDKRDAGMCTLLNGTLFKRAGCIKKSCDPATQNCDDEPPPPPPVPQLPPAPETCKTAGGCKVAIYAAPSIVCAGKLVPYTQTSTSDSGTTTQSGNAEVCIRVPSNAGNSKARCNIDGNWHGKSGSWSDSSFTAAANTCSGGVTNTSSGSVVYSETGVVATSVQGYQRNVSCKSQFLTSVVGSGTTTRTVNFDAATGVGSASYTGSSNQTNIASKLDGSDAKTSTRSSTSNGSTTWTRPPSGGVKVTVAQGQPMPADCR